jgi:hypothetical protein
MRPYKPYIPQTVDEITDMLASFIAGAPTFEDKSGYFPGKTIETEFHRLTEGLRIVGKELGEERYLYLTEMAERMRRRFEADPEDKTGDAEKGFQLILEMEEILTEER